MKTCTSYRREKDFERTILEDDLNFVYEEIL